MAKSSKAAIKKSPAKKTMVQKTAPKKAAMKKVTAKKPAIKKAAVKKAPLKKAAPKKTMLKKAAPEKTTFKKVTTQKAAPKKVAAKKVAPKKTAVKKMKAAKQQLAKVSQKKSMPPKNEPVIAAPVMEPSELSEVANIDNGFESVAAIDQKVTEINVELPGEGAADQGSTPIPAELQPNSGNPYQHSSPLPQGKLSHKPMGKKNTMMK